MPDNTVPTVQPLEGKTSIDDKMLFEPERLSYQSAIAVAEQIADKIAEKSSREAPVVVSDLDFLSDLANLVVTNTLLHTLMGDYTCLRERAEAGDHKDAEAAADAIEESPQRMRSAILGLLPPIAPVAAVTAGLNTVLGIASPFREDVSFSGVKTAVDDLALEIQVASRLKVRKFKTVLIPTFFVVPAHDDGPESLRRRLKSVEDAKLAAWQVVTPKISELVNLDTQLDQAARNGNQAEVDRLTMEVTALRADLSPITEPLAKVDRQFADILSDLKKVDAASGLTGLARLLRAEAIRALNPVFIHVKVVSSGGHNKVTRSLLRTLFTGDGLSFMGGLVVRWALLDTSGAIQDGGILSTSHAGRFHVFQSWFG